MPSGIRLPAFTMTSRSEPSGFAEKTWPLLALRKNKRGSVICAAGLLTFDLKAVVGIALLLSFSGSVGVAGSHVQKAIPLDKGTESGDGFADDQVLHLVR